MAELTLLRDFHHRSDSCWSLPENALFASGAFRIAGWSVTAPPLGGETSGALETGRAGLVPVEPVAAPQEENDSSRLCQRAGSPSPRSARGTNSSSDRGQSGDRACLVRRRTAAGGGHRRRHRREPFPRRCANSKGRRHATGAKMSTESSPEDESQPAWLQLSPLADVNNRCLLRRR